ncbi:MAG: hypothetical protein R3268_00175 [Acidiferrobacterales bacterium]|nr:hypothetical protein [Acidiferrobacterales bacterium]
MSDVIQAAIIGGVAGSLATLTGIWIDHGLQAKRERKRHRLEVLERIAQLLDESANSLINMASRISDERDLEGTAIFRLRSLAVLYLPSAAGEAEQIVNTWIGMFDELNKYRADLKYGRSRVAGPLGSSHDEIMARWKKKIAKLFSNIEMFESKLHKEVRALN